MLGLLRTSSWKLPKNLAKQSLSVEWMLIFKMLLQKEGSGGPSKNHVEACSTQHRCWPKPIDSHLQPYTLRIENKVNNKATLQGLFGVTGEVLKAGQNLLCCPPRSKICLCPIQGFNMASHWNAGWAGSACLVGSRDKQGSDLLFSELQKPCSLCGC